MTKKPPPGFLQTGAFLPNRLVPNNLVASFAEFAFQQAGRLSADSARVVVPIQLFHPTHASSLGDRISDRVRPAAVTVGGAVGVATVLMTAA